MADDTAIHDNDFSYIFFQDSSLTQYLEQVVPS